MKYLVKSLPIAPNADEREVRRAIAKRMNIAEHAFRYEVIKRAAALKEDGYFYKADIVIETSSFIRDTTINFFQGVPSLRIQPSKLKDQPVVVGSGLSGLFATLILAEAGSRPILIEKGKENAPRTLDIRSFEGAGTFGNTSPYLCGIGGRTASQGGQVISADLDPYRQYALDTFLEAKVPTFIRSNACSYLNSKETWKIVSYLCDRIRSLGGEIRFGTSFLGIKRFLGKITGIEIENESGKELIRTKHVILATGPSSPSFLKRMKESGLNLTPRSFFFGMSVEQNQKDFDLRIYKTASKPMNGPDYLLREEVKVSNGRRLYLGFHVPSGRLICESRTDRTVLTGTGGASSSKNAVSTFSVIIDKNEYRKFGGYSMSPELSDIFSSSYRFDYPFHAPSQPLGEFLSGRSPFRFGNVKSSYRPGVYLADLSSMLPIQLASDFRTGVSQINRKIPLFLQNDDLFTGFTMNCSAPIDLAFDAEGRTSIKGVYACLPPEIEEEDLLCKASRGIKTALALLNG